MNSPSPTVRSAAPGRRRRFHIVPSFVVGTWRFMTDMSAGWGAKAILLTAIAYVLFPFDILPDFVPIIGWLDDLGLAAIATGFIVRATRPYREGVVQERTVIETDGVPVD